jgi:hypothetical protein
MKIPEDVRLRLRDMHLIEDTVYAKWIHILTSSNQLIAETTATIHETELSLVRGRPSSQSAGSGMKDIERAKLVFLFGNSISLLSAKISHILEQVAKRRVNSARPVGTVVSVLSDTSSVKAHEVLTQNILHSMNIFPCQSKVHRRKFSLTFIQVSFNIFLKYSFSICLY